MTTKGVRVMLCGNQLSVTLPCNASYYHSALGLNLFVRTPTGVQAITYLIFGNCMIAFTFVLSCFFTSSRTAEVRERLAGRAESDKGGCE